MKRALALPIPVLAHAVSILAGPPALAQPPSAATNLPDAAFAAQKTAFLAMPEATRKAAQVALTWLGFYNGAADGDFGKRTRDAILAFQASLKKPADGTLLAEELKALIAAAAKAQEAVGFRLVDDPKTGARIGAPAKLLAGRDGARLDFASSADADLGTLYARLSAETPTRKVSYKAMKSDDFFVVSGQEGQTKFYTRFDKNGAAAPPIRGFTFAYPAGLSALFDRIAIAVAGSFEPFPNLGAKAPAAAEAATGPAPRPAAGATTAAPGPKVAATALIVAPGEALTALRADDCPNASVAGKPVRIERADAASGLAIISGDFGGQAQAPRFGALAPDLVVLSLAGQNVAASSASLGGDAAKPSVFVALEKSASGGPAFDRRGALVGVVAPIAEEPKRVNGVALAAQHALVGPEPLRAFLGAAAAASSADAASVSAGDVAAREKGRLLAVVCEK